MGFVSCVDIYSFIAANAVVSMDHTGSVTAADCSSTQAAGLKTDDLVCVVIHERTMVQKGP